MLYAVAMAAVMVGVDVLFPRHHFRARLPVSIGIVVVFTACNLRFLKNP